MIGILLVGGKGTRLRPLTLTTPKPLLPVANRPMIERIVARLAEHGIDRVVLSLGYQPEAFQEMFPDDRIAGVPVSYAIEPEPLDTAGAVRFAADTVDPQEPFAVFNGDVLTTQPLEDLVELHRRAGAAGTIALYPVEDPSRFGVVPTDPDGRVLGFIEKPPRDEAPTNEINAGTYVLSPEVLELIPPGVPTSIERDTFPTLVAAGRLYARCLAGYWLDTGTPAQYRQAHTDLLEGAVAMPADAVEIGARVWTQGPVRGAEHVAGPALLGEGASIGADATVVDSSIGPAVVIGDGATITGSVVLAGAVVEAGAVIEDSIVGFSARIGEGAKISGDTIVGSGATVGAGAVHHDDRIGS